MNTATEQDLKPSLLIVILITLLWVPYTILTLHLLHAPLYHYRCLYLHHCVCLCQNHRTFVYIITCPYAKWRHAGGMLYSTSTPMGLHVSFWGTHIQQERQHIYNLWSFCIVIIASACVCFTMHHVACIAVSFSWLVCACVWDIQGSVITVSRWWVRLYRVLWFCGCRNPGPLLPMQS